MPPKWLLLTVIRKQAEAEQSGLLLSFVAMTTDRRTEQVVTASTLALSECVCVAMASLTTGVKCPTALRLVGLLKPHTRHKAFVLNSHVVVVSTLRPHVNAEKRVRCKTTK